jgi:predicted transcriptional regulator
MGRPQSPDPTDGELELLRVLWTRGACSIADFQEELAKTRPMGYTTVQSNLLKMIDKGFIRRDERTGKIVTYTALINENETKQRFLKRLAETFFGG